METIAGGIPSVADVRFQVLTEQVDHPDVKRLLDMLHRITVNFHEGTCPIPASAEHINSLINGIDMQASTHLKLCLFWSYNMAEINGETLLQITAREFEFASPIGYTQQ